VAPEHQEPITTVKISADLRLGEAAFVQFFQQAGFAFESGIGGDQPATDATCRARNHFVPQAAAALRCVTPQFIEAADHRIGTGGATDKYEKIWIIQPTDKYG